MGIEGVRAAPLPANAPPHGGVVEDGNRRFQVYTNDQANRADDYRPLVIAYRNGAPVRLTDIGEVRDSVENLRNLGLLNGKPAVLVTLYRQPAERYQNCWFTVQHPKEIGKPHVSTPATLES